MKTEIQASIGGIDGERGYTIVTPSLQEALKFLEQYDHEGSSVSLLVKTYDEDVYELLRTLITKS